MSTTAIDVASYIVSNEPLMTTLKLQKLVYYSYVEYASKHNKPLFADSIEAWINGPVVRNVYRLHRSRYFAEPEMFAGSLTCDLAEEAKEAVDITLAKYRDFTPRKLVEKTHSESPWIDARGDLAPDALSENEITFESILSWLKSEDHAA